MGMYCNPLNLDYGYQHYGKGAHREGADPTLICFKGCYYLFVSMCGGFFYSDDLAHWQFHENHMDLYRYAPDVREVNGQLVFCASTRGKVSTFWRTDDPLSDQFEKVSEPFAFWDPDLFCDDDGSCYLYWGCDCNQPIYGRRMDSKTLLPLEEPQEVIKPDAQNHGWERPHLPWMPKKKKNLFDWVMKLSGRDGEKYPYFEGAFMTKINGKYYLQYAAPGTELPTYGNGTYVGDTPMGPFRYQEHNPISLKTGGFAKGAGHGSTIADSYGNLWHAATMMISVNANFERRCGLFPAGVDEDGILFCNQNFADYPLDIPEGKFDARLVEPKWMLVSYKKKVSVSSETAGHEGTKAVDENIRTSWCAQGSKNEWLMIDLGECYQVGAVQLNIADVDVPLLKVDKEKKSDIATGSRYIDRENPLYTRWIMEYSLDGKDWMTLCDKSDTKDNLPDDFIELPQLTSMRYVRVTSVSLPYNKKFAINGLRVFGEGNVQRPAPVKGVTAERICDDLSCKVSWNKVDGALGYNVRYGIAPDKLYLSHMQYEDTEVRLGSLNKGQKYYFTVDCFNESGITKGTAVVVLE